MCYRNKTSMYIYDIDNRLSGKIYIVTLKNNFQGQRSRSNEKIFIFYAILTF